MRVPHFSNSGKDVAYGVFKKSAIREGREAVIITVEPVV